MNRLLWGVPLLLAGTVGLAACRTLAEPGDLWRHSGVFAGCPARPSCVSSAATDAQHAIAPLRYEADPAAARDRLVAALQQMPGNHIEHATPEYLHAVFVTPTMRFHDDLELLIGSDGAIQARSISRFGYRDFGVNRERVERLRALFERPAD